MSRAERHEFATDLRAPAPDPASFMLIATALVGLGVTMIYSASAGVVGSPDGPVAWVDGHLSFNWRFLQDPGLRQLYFVPPALLTMWLTSRLPHTFWRLRDNWLLSPVIWFAFITLLLVVGVLFFGVERNGARRWFSLGGGFLLQPSELAKLALVLLLAALMSDNRLNPRSFLRGLLPLLVIVAAFALPVVKEDFGTAALMALVAICLLLMAVRVWQLLLFVPPIALVGAIFILTSDYRRRRIEQWLAGNVDTQGGGYHVHQSLLTIASGGWPGRGLGDGIQKFEYLPEDTTDFIFAVVCEELGLVGAFIVIGLFIMLLWQLRRAARFATDQLGQLIVLGVMLTIGIQVIMNIAVVTDLVPPKGIALPFVSAGGSGLIIMSAALGIAASVARSARKTQPC